MVQISDKALVFIIGASLILSLVGLFGLPHGSLSILSGFVTQGQARVSIGTYAALNVTQPLIDFGNGTVHGNAKNCTINSEKQTLQNPTSCWNGTVATSGGFAVLNIGNVKLNITIKATKNSSTSLQTAFWGVTGGKVLWKCRGSKNTNATFNFTTGNRAYPSKYTYVSNATTRCADKLNVSSGQDAFTLDMNITIPDIAVGIKNDTVTFTGIKACSVGNC